MDGGSLTIVYIIFVWFPAPALPDGARGARRASPRFRCQTGQYRYQNDPEKSEGGDSGEVRRVGGGPEGRSILTLLLSVKMSFTQRELWGEGKREVGSSVADPDPGSGAFLTPGSGIRNGFVLDPGFPNSFLGPKKIAPEMLTTP